MCFTFSANVRLSEILNMTTATFSMLSMQADP
jgi:hypothetical protein